jgi:hypothetical protein
MRVKEGRWVGYDTHSKGHRVYWGRTNQVTVEWSIIFSRDKLPCVEDKIVVDENVEDSAEKEGELAGEEPSAPIHAPPGDVGANITTIPVNQTLPVLRRSERLRKASQYVKDVKSAEFLATRKEGELPIGIQKPNDEEGLIGIVKEINGIAMAAQMGEVSGYEPATLQEAMRSPDWNRWKEAMDEEHTVLETHNTWKLVDAPPGANIVGCRWVFALKRDAAGNIIRYKARLVAQGYSQVPGIDFNDMYAPVTKMASIQTILALAAYHNHEIHQVDVKNAYLNGEFKEGKVIYMKLPPGIELTKDKKKVLLLLKPLYGLKQARRYWYKKLHEMLRERLELVRCEVDHAVFVIEKKGENEEMRKKEGETSLIVVHVDDLTLVTMTEQSMQHVKGELKKAFKFTDMGKIHWILGFSVKRN